MEAESEAGHLFGEMSLISLTRQRSLRAALLFQRWALAAAICKRTLEEIHPIDPLPVRKHVDTRREY